MAVMRKGIYLELRNIATSRIVFSAATDELDPNTFLELWKTVGTHIYKNANPEGRGDHYELRVSPIT